MQYRFKRAYLASLAVLLLGIALYYSVTPGPVSAASAINKGSDGIALKGYDVVAYFTEGKATKGKPEFQHEWMGAKWQFSTAANRHLFAANPSQYAPQYGGYCAYGVSEGHRAPIDPNVWKVVGGKLYLNYNASVGKEWQRDIPGRIAKANKNWEKIANQ